MRTTIDLPDKIVKKAKMEAIKQGITLKEFFQKALEKELSTVSSSGSSSPWQKLRGMGAASNLSPEDSGFEGYSGPDWQAALQVNEPQ
jgi:hypothetical protein